MTVLAARMTAAPRGGQHHGADAWAEIAVGASCQRCGYGNVTGIGPPRKTRRLGRPGPSRFPFRPARWRGAVPRSSLSPPGSTNAGCERLGGLSYGHAPRGSGACDLDPEDGRTRRPRSRLRRGTRGAPVRGHGGRHGRGQCPPRSHSAKKRLSISHGRNTMAGKEAEPIDRRDRLGRRGTRRLHAPITLPDCIRPLLERRFLKGGDP
jgi:hypothetical protein